MLTCLQNLVGVKGCASTPSTIYIQQLPSITIPDIDASLGGSHANAKAYLEDKINLATEFVEAQLQMFLQEKYATKTLFENKQAGIYPDLQSIITTQTGYYTGVKLSLNNLPNVKLFINKLNFWTDYDGTVTVKVFNLTTGQELHSADIETTAGEISEGDFDFTYTGNGQPIQLFIGYDNTFDVYRVNLSAVNDCDVCTVNTGAAVLNIQSAKINNATAPIKANIESNTGTGGISFSYSLTCCLDNFLCAAKNSLAFIVLYKAGEQIMKDLQYNKQLVGTIVNYRGEHEELAAYFDAEYNKYFRAFVNGLSVSDTFCFKCNPTVKLITSLP